MTSQNNLEQASSIFITGFPGFIAKYLITQILTQRPQTALTLLVHPTMAKKAQAMLPHLGTPSQNFHLVQGDITQPNLGLDADVTQALQKNIHVVFHLAAIYDLQVPEATAKLANITGTQNVLNFFSSSQSLLRFNYISTCYVSGKRTGRIMADQLTHDYPFHNFYESTKYGAEVLVKNHLGKLPITIFRPAIVVGHSQTGETEKFDGPYLVLKLLHRLRFFLRLIPNLGSPSVEANTVPVDYVTQVMARLGFDPQATGKTFQICDPAPPSAEAFYSELVWIIARARPYRCPWLRDLILRCLRLRPAAALTGLPAQALDYFAHPGQYRCPEVVKALESSSIHLPQFSTYYPRLYQYMTRSTP